MFEILMDELEEVVERLAGRCVPAGASTLVRLAQVADRLAALECAAQVRFDAAQGWRERGAVSLCGWLRDEGGLSRRSASASAKRSERLERWPAVAEASDGPEQFRERPSTVFAGASFDGRFAMSVDLAGADGAIVEAALIFSMFPIRSTSMAT